LKAELFDHPLHAANADLPAALDQFLGDHLANALKALDGGCDLYFSNISTLDSEKSLFDLRPLDLTAFSRPIEGPGRLFEYIGDRIDLELKLGIWIQTVVYRYEVANDLRFAENFRYCGEDNIFAVNLVKRARRIAFSSVPEVRCGKGVNLYQSVRAGTDKYALRVIDEIRYRKVILRENDLNPEQKLIVGEAIKHYRINYASNLLSMLTAGSLLRPSSFWRYVTADPLGPLHWVPLMARAAKRKWQG